MKRLVLLILPVFILLVGCVQKTYKKTVVITLNTSGIENIKTVGIRGNDKPLDWDKDVEMSPVKKDSLYTVTFSIITGYRFTEVKFVINGEFELKNENNRRIDFAAGDTTLYKAVFNKR